MFLNMTITYSSLGTKYFEKHRPPEQWHDIDTESKNSLRSIAWNPLGTLIAAGSADRTLRV